MMVKDKMTLPFEVTYSETPGKKSKGMKRLAIIVRAENVDDITSSLKTLGLDSTIYDVKRQERKGKESQPTEEWARWKLSILQER